MPREEDNEARRPADLPEEFVWDHPPWIRTDRFRARPVRFVVRVLVGGFLGLLFGRVAGSLEGLFLQWVWEAATRAAPILEPTLGRLLYGLGVTFGALLSPLCSGSPLWESLADLQTLKSGAAALLFLAQLHGALNGLHQGLKPALGARVDRFLERALLSWGFLWRVMTTPLRAVRARGVDDVRLAAMLRNADDPTVQRRLRSLARDGALAVPSLPVEPEAHTLEAWHGKVPPQRRASLWWVRPAFRAEVYRWIGVSKRMAALPLLAHGLSDPDDMAREAAIASMASLESRSAVPYLVALLQEEDRIKKLAIEGLKRIGQRAGEAV